MFSARLRPSWTSNGFEQNPLTRLLAQKRAAGVALRDLTESNPTRAGIAYPPAVEILGALADPAAMTYTPDPRGLASARAAVACHEGGCTTDDMILCASTSEAYAWLFKLLCDPGDAVLAPAPSYPLFEYLAALEGVTLVPYPLVWDGAWRIDFAGLEATLAATPRARALLIVNPNNPTGSYLQGAELMRLGRLAGPRGIAIISDEVFARYPATDDFVPGRVLCASSDVATLTFSLGGLSKCAGLPQLKLAWIYAGGPRAQRRDALARLELIADSYLSVSTPVQLAAPRLLAAGARIRAAILARVRANRAWLTAQLPRGSAVELYPAEGGWSAVLRYPATRTDEELALALLRDHDVLVHPGYFFDFPRGTYLVVSLLVPPATLAAATPALLAGCGSPT